MCVVSMIYDHFHDKWQPRPTPPWFIPPTVPTQPSVPAITPDEIEEFRRLLERAREYDRRTGQPDCELEEKRQKLKKLADELGVAIDFI